MYKLKRIATSESHRRLYIKEIIFSFLFFFGNESETSEQFLSEREVEWKNE